MNKTVYLKKISVVVIAQLLMATGGAFLFCSGSGNDPFGVFVNGIANLFHTTFGLANLGISIVIVMVCAVFYRKNLSVTTLITAIIPGLVLDFYITIINSFHAPLWMVRYVYPFIGCFILGVFIACYLSVQTGASCLDNLILWIADTIKKDYRGGFLLASLFFVLIGIPLGGVWGFATFVTFFGTGSVVKWTAPLFENTVKKWACHC